MLYILDKMLHTFERVAWESNPNLGHSISYLGRRSLEFGYLLPYSGHLLSEVGRLFPKIGHSFPKGGHALYKIPEAFSALRTRDFYECGWLIITVLIIHVNLIPRRYCHDR